MHQPPVLRGHRQKDFLKWVGIIINEGQDATEPIDEVIEEATVNLGFDSVDEDREAAWYGGKGLMENCWKIRGSLLMSAGIQDVCARGHVRIEMSYHQPSFVFHSSIFLSGGSLRTRRHSSGS